MESQEHIFMINSSVERTRGNRAINAAEDENYGEILKSGDNTLLRYKIFDGDGESLQLEGLPCEAVIKKDDIVVYETPAEVDAENIVSFKITEVLPSDRNDPYTIEFVITQDQDTLIFPSDDRINLYIYPSSLSVDGEIIKQTPEDRLNEIVIVAVNDATQDFYSEVDDFRDTYNELIDTGVVQENINQKLAESEAEYAPRLTELEQNDADLTAQLAQTENDKVDKDGSQQVKWANIAQDAREQISGDKVAVVGEDSVGTENITNNAVTFDKTDFADEVSIRAKNIVTNDFTKDSDGDGIADGWRANSSSATQPRLENNTQYWLPLTSGWNSAISNISSEGIVEGGHQYYISLEQKNIGEIWLSGTEIAVQLGISSDGYFSKIFTPNVDGTGRLSFNGRLANTESSIKNVVLVNLTKTFGVGKEPTIEYFEFLLDKTSGGSWFDTVNFTNAKRNGIITSKDLKIYDPDGEINGDNVHDALVNLEKNAEKIDDKMVYFESGKNLYNPQKNANGTILRQPSVGRGKKQQIDTIDNPANHEYQLIKIINDGDVALSNINVYSVTDLNHNVVITRRLTDVEPTIISADDIDLEEYLLWVAVGPSNIGSAQVEKSSYGTAYEPYIPVTAVYANGVKLFDYPLNITSEADKKKEIYELAMNALNESELIEEIQYLTNNAEKGNLNKESPNKDSQNITLNNPVSQKLILHLHKREEEEGFGKYNNAYLPNVKDDFSDVKVTTESGEVLPYRVVHKSNDFDIVPYDWIRRGQSASATFIDSEGVLYQSENYIRKSTDKGKTWTTIPSLESFYRPGMRLIAKDDTMYFTHESKLYRSEPPYTDYQMVFDLDPLGTYGDVIITGKSLVQHPDGELFAGLYQLEWNINIYKSIDNGITWQLCADFGDAYQHVHGLFIDEYTGAIYAGLDGGGGVLKSTDKGETWVDLREQNPDMPQSTDYGVRYADASGYRLLGGETPIVGGHSIIKTYDDENFYPVLSDGISVNYVIKLGDVMFATGSGSNSMRNGAIYVSRDDAESWEGVYRTSPIRDLWSANDGYRYMEQISNNEILVGPQSISRPPLRIFGEGAYAEIIVDVPEGTTSINVESGHVYPNERPIVNDTDFVGDKILHFELNENANVIKENVSGNIFEDEFEWANIGKHLSYFYPYIISPKENNSVLMKSLSGYDIDIEGVDISSGITLSFWMRMSPETKIVILEDENGNKLEIVYGYQLHFNRTNIISIGHPIMPLNFIKIDVVIDSNGDATLYQNGLLRYTNTSTGSGLLSMLEKGGKLTALRNSMASDTDAIQHLIIRKGMVSEEQLLAEYNSGITDNIDK